MYYAFYSDYHGYIIDDIDLDRLIRYARGIGYYGLIYWYTDVDIWHELYYIFQ